MKAYGPREIRWKITEELATYHLVELGPAAYTTIAKYCKLRGIVLS